MQNKTIKNALATYNPQTYEEIKNVFREIMQNIILSGLSRGSFFNDVAFYGGTSLRIIHNLERFSEDLDFNLLSKKEDFALEDYLKFAVNELKAYGIDSFANIKDKSRDSSVITGYIKANLKSILDTFYPDTFQVNREENISVKVEVETNLSEGYVLEYHSILFPSYFKIKTFDFSTLFSCKITAILNRKWGMRVKGRDYYDFLFYMKNNVKPNYAYLKASLNNENIDRDSLVKMLVDKFNSIDFSNAWLDVESFVNDSRIKDLFTKEIFIDVANKIQ